MTKYLILYACCALIFFPIDYVWLSSMGNRFYRRELGDLMLAQPNFVIAAAFYLAYVLGVVILVAAPADGDWVRALMLGAVLGFVAYGTYDLTNLSTMRGFTPTVAIVDMAWGTFLTAITAGGGVWLASRFT
ncbi:DUF2177 family protein [Arsenicitalea aurantiaca]|uniref:DUF2177 family protein n=1 Tax=Arsenicitalea aurantiaca TaxID=1783274 RepID=A0A433XLP5_9HYPH|nr:DUF2177 family protein [Arsenicitalea aurantiaca]RUT34981.1 DUF2177 family protein [Arsenicitalea aurantiaca]